MKICGIDPGLKGAIAFIDKNAKPYFYEMPIVKETGEIDHDEILIKLEIENPDHVFIERAVSFGMGSLGAFNYGRGFGFLELAVRRANLPHTYVEPGKWTKIMHSGIEADLKPKAKSQIAIKRLLPRFYDNLPKNKNGKLKDGVIDAILIALYGLRILSP